MKKFTKNLLLSLFFTLTLNISAFKGITDKVEKYTAEIADLKQTIDINLKKCFFELNRLTNYIQEVEDPLIRQIMTYRYIHGFNWQKTAINIGGNNSADSLKKQLYRYLKNKNSSLNVPF